MQNEKSTITKSKNVPSGSIPELQYKFPTNEQSINQESRKKNRVGSPRKRKRRKQKPISSLIHRLFRPESFFKNEKIKTRFINFFNIKELIILLDVNSTFLKLLSNLNVSKNI